MYRLICENWVQDEATEPETSGGHNLMLFGVSVLVKAGI